MGSIEVFKLFGSILIDSDEANKSIAKTGKESEGLASKMGKGIKTAGKWALGITTAAIGIGAAAFAMTKKVTGAFDDIAKNSRKMGVSTDYYQEMEYWASQNGLSHENMEKSMKRLNQRLGQAVEGNEKYSNALTRLGVDLREVEKGNITTEQAMTQSIQALSQMENSQEKAALASELFGTKLSQELMPAIDGGALSIEDAQKKAEELGIVIGEDTLNAAEKFNDSWDDMTRSLGAFGQKVLAELMPIFQSMMDWVLAHMPQIQKVFQTVFDVIGIVFNGVVDAVKTVIGWFTSFKDNTSGTLSEITGFFKLFGEMIVGDFQVIFQKISDIISGVIGFIIPMIQEGLAFISELWSTHGQGILDKVTDVFFQVYDFIIYGVIRPMIDFIEYYLGQLQLFWETHGQALLENAMNTFGAIAETVETYISAIWEIIQTVIGWVVPFVEEQLAKIKQFWDENGEQIMQAINNVYQFIMGVIQFAMDFIQKYIAFAMPIVVAIFKGAWDIISSVFKTAIDVILGVVKFFISLFTGDWKGMGTALLDIWNALWNGIKGVLSGAWSMLSGAFGALWGNISGWFTGLKDSALDWGKNMISGFIDGIKNMAGKVKDAAKGVIDNVTGFLKFWSPAREGEGRFVTDWGENMVDGFLDGVRNETSEAGKVMNDLIEGMSPKSLDFTASVGSRGFAQSTAITDNLDQPTSASNTKELLIELIQAVKDGKYMQVDGKTFAQVTGDYAAEEGGNRVRIVERGLAT